MVCDARSGSGFLCNDLNGHPRLACHHEPFDPNFEASQYGVQPFHRSAETEPLTYLAAMRSRTQAASGAELVGFKLRYRQNATALDQLLADPRQRVVLLTRRDKLAQWASYRLALLTHQWTQPRDNADIRPLTQVPFVFRHFTIYLAHQFAWERRILDQRTDVLRVEYEDIIRPHGLAPVLRFLHVDPSVELRPGTRRQFIRQSTYERFTNPRWAAFSSPIARLAARLIALSGATELVCRYTRY